MKVEIERKRGSSGMVTTMTTPSGDTLFRGVEGVGTPTWFTTEREALESLEQMAAVDVEGYKRDVQGRRRAVAHLEDIRAAIALAKAEGA